MKTLIALLERFSRSLNKDTHTKETIARVVESKTRVLVPTENLSLKDGVLSITTGATAKNEIRLKEEVIKKELKELHKITFSRILYK
jgi:hypothetical protein